MAGGPSLSQVPNEKERNESMSTYRLVAMINWHNFGATALVQCHGMSLQEHMFCARDNHSL